MKAIELFTTSLSRFVKRRELHKLPDASALILIRGVDLVRGDDAWSSLVFVSEIMLSPAEQTLTHWRPRRDGEFDDFPEELVPMAHADDSSEVQAEKPRYFEETCHQFAARTFQKGLGIERLTVEQVLYEDCTEDVHTCRAVQLSTRIGHPTMESPSQIRRRSWKIVEERSEVKEASFRGLGRIQSCTKF